MGEFNEADLRAASSHIIRTATDESEMRKARIAAEKEAEQLTTDQWKAIRYRMKTDLFFLATGFLGFKKLTINLHGHFCRWLRRTEAQRYREILLPRGHYKSTIATITDSIQIALPDVAGDSAYPRNLGPNVRILIAHEVAAKAEHFLAQITSNVCTNPLLIAFFPEIVPSPKTQRINKTELELPRTEYWSEATIATMGVGGKTQSMHHNVLKLDDIIGAETRESETLMAYAKDWLDNIPAFLSDFGLDHIDLIGTRWALGDVYEHFEGVYGDELARYCRAVTELNKETGEEESIFPEGGFTAENLRKLQQNPKNYTAQYLNDPQRGGGLLEKEWLHEFTWHNERTVKFKRGDEWVKVSTDDMDRLVLVDPAMSGPMGIIVCGVDDYNRVFILEALKPSIKPDAQCELIFKLRAKWWPRLVVIEDVLFSALYKPWFEAEMRLRGSYFTIVPHKVNKRDKDVRVMALEPFWRVGQIYHHASQVELLKEYAAFGTWRKYHLLDSLAQGIPYWRAGKTTEQRRHEEEAESRYIDSRDVNTGYSEIYPTERKENVPTKRKYNAF